MFKFAKSLVKHCIPQKLTKDSRRKQNARSMQLERLESRELMAVAAINLRDHRVIINTDNLSTNVSVKSVGSSTVIQDVGTNRSWSYPASSVRLVEFHGGNGNDRFVNQVKNLPVVARGNGGNDHLEGYDAADQLFGGAGKDTLVGSGGNDVLSGGSGNDTIRGGKGNDVIRGGTGNDRLYGGEGHDEIFGGAGSDYLYGEAGNDSLYGGSGIDSLFGGDGNDGLFGGVGGQDRLHGGNGNDRFLSMTAIQRQSYYKNEWDRIQGKRSYRDVVVVEDNILDRRGEDAVIQFRNLERTTINLTGFGPTTFSAGRWSDTKIQAVDVALRNLHDVTGNTKLLKQNNGTDLVFERAGAQSTNLAGGAKIGGWNGAGKIAFTNTGLENALSAQMTTYHEIAHNWDEQHENRFINQFRGISGWTSSRTTPAGFSPSSASGDNWHYRNNATFARNYGRFNPVEDYATAWESYFSRRYHNNVTEAANLPEKFANIDAFFASLR